MQRRDDTLLDVATAVGVQQHRDGKRDLVVRQEEGVAHEEAPEQRVRLVDPADAHPRGAGLGERHRHGVADAQMIGVRRRRVDEELSGCERPRAARCHPQDQRVVDA